MDLAYSGTISYCPLGYTNYGREGGFKIKQYKTYYKEYLRIAYCILTEVFLNLTEVFLTLTEVFRAFSSVVKQMPG
jgi:hypothetical protein